MGVKYRFLLGDKIVRSTLRKEKGGSWTVINLEMVLWRVGGIGFWKGLCLYEFEGNFSEWSRDSMLSSEHVFEYREQGECMVGQPPLKKLFTTELVFFHYLKWYYRHQVTS